MTTLKCQNCGGTVELNSELPIAFCPYCGEKSFIDDATLSSLYIEKEKTKQAQARKRTVQLERETTKQIRLRRSIERARTFRHLLDPDTIFSLIMLVFVVVICLLIFLDSCR